MEENELLICQCDSTEHQICFFYSEVDKYVFMHVHLNKLPFLERLVYGIKYIFGRKCKYGAFDEFIFNHEDYEKINRIANYLKKINN